MQRFYGPGAWYIYNGLTNNGIWHNSISDGGIFIYTGDFKNTGSFTNCSWYDGDDIAVSAGNFENSGTYVAGRLTLSGNLTNSGVATLSSGTVTGLTTNSSTGAITRNSFPSGPPGPLRLNGGFTNQGTYTATAAPAR